MTKKGSFMVGVVFCDPNLILAYVRLEGRRCYFTIFVKRKILEKKIGICCGSRGIGPLGPGL